MTVDGAGRLVHYRGMTGQPHILVVDDDAAIRRGVAKYLAQNAMRVTAAGDGREMRARLAAGRFDLVLLDVMLPGEDGLLLLRGLRADTDIPAILITAVSAETDRVIGLEIGAEDYVCKPFSLRELLARVRVVLRRGRAARVGAPAPVSGRFTFEDWTLDVRARTLTSTSRGYVDLTTGEFDLLQAFVERPNRLLNRDQLLDLARGRANRAIDVQVMRLRRKLEQDPQSPTLIKTVRNGGYIFTPEVLAARVGPT